MRVSPPFFPRPATVLVLTLVHTGCLGGGQEEVATGAIVDGQAEAGHIEVGGLETRGTVCSATLVAPRVAISAKHCIQPDTTPGDVTLRFGDQVVVATGLFHEGAFSPGGGTPPQDFLALSLDRDVVGIVPAPVRRAPLERSFDGKAVQIVGFGKVSGADGAASGERRSGWTEVDSIQDDTFKTKPTRRNPATTCQGDSGGAVFFGGELVGVISGTYGHCDSALHARVDRHVALYDEAVRRAGRGGSERDSCRWANDGVCDVPSFCEPGADATDCSNGCTWARDGVCDEPWVCTRDTDAVDCAPSRARCRWAHDGACDEPYLCAAGTDEGDCPSAAPEE